MSLLCTTFVHQIFGRTTSVLEQNMPRGKAGGRFWCGNGAEMAKKEKAKFGDKKSANANFSS